MLSLLNAPHVGFHADEAHIIARRYTAAFFQPLLSLMHSTAGLGPSVSYFIFPLYFFLS